MTDNASAASCPAGYGYAASVMAGPAAHDLDTVFVIGGLYGNEQALAAILAMRDAEAMAGVPVTLVFNGDHNWLNADPASFARINAEVLGHIALRGNVETELGAPSGDGCGCNYPAYVNADYASTSNAIMARLQATAAGFPDIARRLAALPATLTVKVGAARIGIVHGDAEQLAGWSFAAERLSSVAKCVSGDKLDAAPTSPETLAGWFRAADVSAFASTHTCLAHATTLAVDGRPRGIFNNGAAGMPNFAGTTFGLLTRISHRPERPVGSLYGCAIDGVRFDALPVPYDRAAFRAAFLANWPEGSPAHTAYFARITDGPAYDVADAMGAGLSAGPRAGTQRSAGQAVAT